MTAQRARSFVLATLLAMVAAPPSVTAGDWRLAGRLADVRLRGAADVTLEAETGRGARLELPVTVLLEGRRHRALEIGLGEVRLLADPATPALGPEGRALVAPSDPGPRAAVVPLLAGAHVRNGPNGRVLALTAHDGAAIRWTELVLPDGSTATVELVVDVTGRLRAQYLRVPPTLGGLLAAERVRVPRGVSPAPASAWTLEPESLPVPADPRSPHASGPPPAGCAASPGSWCDQADGPGTTTVWLREGFDDGQAAARGWSRSNGQNQWHEVADTTCPPGASASPGRAWYCGSDATCDYADSNGGDSLYSPTFGPLTTGARLTFLTRLEKEDPYDQAEVYVNNVRLASFASPPSATAWYTVTTLDLSPWAGQSVRIEFRFSSDRTIHATGWFVDDVVVWDATSSNAECVLRAGTTGHDPCGQRVSTQWDFNEGAFCQGCTYTFYALVECGREMHLPLDDMEGADIQVTNVLTGAPVPLRCVNQTARADAGQGAHPVIAGLSQDCCGDAGLEEWWGPAFDVTDNAGPGHVTWGFPSCASVASYDANGNGAYDCAELGTCGGELPLLSPGEFQTMDCGVVDESGLCGLYRIDVSSGGFAWRLFANCDGTSTPQFQLYQDCTEAWAAYNPLPEVAVANLSTSGGCPNLLVTFDLVNIGCLDHPGPTTVRLSSDCSPSDVRDVVVPGAIPANGFVRVTDLAFDASCSPVRVEVRADPDDVVEECTESAGAAACRAEAGVDSLATYACGCTANLAAEAGPDLALCPGDAYLLDGSASTISPCAQPLYRWRDGAGAVLRDWSPDPTLAGTLDTCPADASITLDVSCSGETCVDSSSLALRCLAPLADAGRDVRECAGAPLALSGAGSSVAGCAAVEYRWSAPTGTVLQDWGASAAIALGPLDPSLDGDYRLDVRCSGTPSCTATDTVSVTAVQVVANAGPDVLACEGLVVQLSGSGGTASGCSTLLFQWSEGLLPLSPPSPLPDLPPLAFTGCPGVRTLVLRAWCAEPGLEACVSWDERIVTCNAPAQPAPSATPRCDGPSADLACGIAEAGTTLEWDLDVATDSDGDGLPGNDTDAVGCDTLATWPSAGTRTARVTAIDPFGCLRWTELDVTVAAAVVPLEVTGDRATRAGASLTLTWDASPGAASFRVSRGTLASLRAARAYDHRVDPGASVGACDAGRGPSWTDPDDAAEPGAFYYLVTAVTACGAEGPAGAGRTSAGALPRPARLPGGSCP